VWTLTYIRAATSRLLSPSATSPATTRSVSVRLSQPTVGLSCACVQESLADLALVPPHHGVGGQGGGDGAAVEPIRGGKHLSNSVAWGIAAALH
jgi:hypothetical protein